MAFIVDKFIFLSRRRLSTLAAWLLAVAANPVLGRWYFMYSGGSWGKDNYRISCYVGDSPFGPQKPIATGAGHNSVIRDIHIAEDRLNAPDDRFRDHLTGRLHP